MQAHQGNTAAQASAQAAQQTAKQALQGKRPSNRNLRPCPTATHTLARAAQCHVSDVERVEGRGACSAEEGRAYASTHHARSPCPARRVHTAVSRPGRQFG